MYKLWLQILKTNKDGAKSTFNLGIYGLGLKIRLVYFWEYILGIRVRVRVRVKARVRVRYKI